MSYELEVLRDVSEKLACAGIPYMLTGSWALNYYAEPRMTRDIDVVVELDAQRADKLIELFESEYYIPQNAVARALANQSLFNIIHSQRIVKVDFIIRKNTAYRLAEFSRRRQVEVQDMMVWIVSKEDLIISKLIWAKESHSEFQLRDVRNLLKSGYDSAYLTQWTRELGLSELLRECLNAGYIGGN
jgi:hypothetical protein